MPSNGYELLQGEFLAVRVGFCVLWEGRRGEERRGEERRGEGKRERGRRRGRKRGTRIEKGKERGDNEKTVAYYSVHVILYLYKCSKSFVSSFPILKIRSAIKKMPTHKT